MKRKFNSCGHDGLYHGDPGQPCIDALVAWYTNNHLDPTPTKRIWAKVQAACAEGEADACDVVPGEEIDAHVRCEAGDYGACTRLAEGGDGRQPRLRARVA